MHLNHKLFFKNGELKVKNKNKYFFIVFFIVFFIKNNNGSIIIVVINKNSGKNEKEKALNF